MSRHSSELSSNGTKERRIWLHRDRQRCLRRGLDEAIEGDAWSVDNGGSSGNWTARLDSLARRPSVQRDYNRYSGQGNVDAGQPKREGHTPRYRA